MSEPNNTLPITEVESKEDQPKRGRGRPRIHQKTARKPNSAMAEWRQVAKANGYLVKREDGQLKRLPKKGTDEYIALRAKYEEFKANKATTAMPANEPVAEQEIEEQEVEEQPKPEPIEVEQPKKVKKIVKRIVKKKN